MNPQEERQQFNRFDLVEDCDIKLGIIISDPFTAYFYEAGELDSPSSYSLIAHDVVTVFSWIPFGEVEVRRLVNLRPSSIRMGGRYQAYIPLDEGLELGEMAKALKQFSSKLSQG